MEKKKGFQMPHTYIIIFGVILFAALLTVFIPLGKYDTKEITYMQNGVEKTRTVLDPESFQYILDENGNISPDKLKPITFDPVNHTYLVLGEKVGNAFQDGKELK